MVMNRTGIEKVSDGKQVLLRAWDEKALARFDIAIQAEGYETRNEWFNAQVLAVGGRPEPAKGQRKLNGKPAKATDAQKAAQKKARALAEKNGAKPVKKRAPKAKAAKRAKKAPKAPQSAPEAPSVAEEAPATGGA